MLWMLWIKHNDLVFDNKRWNLNKVHKVMWDAFLDYSRTTWNKCVRLIKQTPRANKKLIKKFDRSWGRHQVIHVKVDNFVRWCYDGPQRGFIN